MQIVEIRKNENGSHRNQTYSGIIPDGWALVPDDLITKNFPFGDIETCEKSGQTIVTNWSPLPIPEIPEEPESEPQDKDSEVWDAIADAIREGVNEVD